MNKQFWIRIVQSFNPNSYHDLSNEHLKSSLTRFFLLFLVLMGVSALIFIPAIFFQAPGIKAKLGSFDNITISGNFSANNSVIILKSPKVIFDTNTTSVEDARLVFGKDYIYYKTFLWSKTKKLPYDEISDLKSSGSKYIIWIMLFLWPSIVFWSSIIVIIKYVFLILIFSSIGWAVTGAFGFRISLKKAIKAGIYSASTLMIIEMLIIPFWRSAIIFSILFIIWFTISLMLLSEKKINT